MSKNMYHELAKRRERRRILSMISFLASVCLLLYIFISLTYSHYVFVKGSVKLDGTLVQIVKENQNDEYTILKDTYSGVYSYVDVYGNYQYIDSIGCNISEESVPKTVTIYYNKNLNAIKVKQELKWIVNRYHMGIISFIILVICSIIVKKLDMKARSNSTGYKRYRPDKDYYSNNRRLF